MSIDELMRKLEEQVEKDNKRILNRIFPKGIFGYNSHHAILHPWIIIKYMFREVIYAWQRAFRGWDDTATWNINLYLAELIPQLLRNLKENRMGIPGSCIDDETMNNNGVWSSDKAEAEAMLKWDTVLIEMITGFEAYKKMDEASYFSPERKFYKVQFNRAMDLFKIHFDDLWD